VVRISLIGESEGAISWMYRVYHVAQAAVVTEFWTCRCFIARVALVIVGDHC
jgi:hypothetical protein